MLQFYHLSSYRAICLEHFASSRAIKEEQAERYRSLLIIEWANLFSNLTFVWDKIREANVLYQNVSFSDHTLS